MIFNKIMSNKLEYPSQNGFMLLAILGATTLFLLFAMGMASLSIYQNRLYQQQYAKTQALHVAEAGINYYVWHLAHNQNDYYDGTGSDPGASGVPYGPYLHTFASPTGEVAGTYSLEITPPPAGSTIVKIKSIGWLNNHPNIKRTIEVRYGIPSLAHYSFLTNTDIWFGEDESVVGDMHSNGGVRMDGTNDALITSARSTYYCPSGQACNTLASCHAPCSWRSALAKCECPGVWGAGSGAALWKYPVTTINYNNITTDINKLLGQATSSGIYLGPFSSPSPDKGYHIIFKNNGTIDIYKVTRLQNALRQYNDEWDGWDNNIYEEIRNESFYQNRAIPNNGVIYIEDDVWVEGIVKGRVTLVAAKLPDNSSTRKTIFINNNITYLARDGTNILGLIAQKHVKVPRHAPSTLNIDGILLSQYGRVFRNLYNSPLIKDTISVYGGIITNQTWTWTWVSGNTVTDGYRYTVSTYDSQVTFSPPPSFPTTNEYTFISWYEN